MKKNQVPIKWILGILIILMVMLYGTQRVSGTALYFFNKNGALSPIIQFLASMIGLGNQNEPPMPTGGHFPVGASTITLPSEPGLNADLLPTGGHVPNRITENVSPGTLPAEIPANVKATQGTELNADQNPGNLTGMNSQNNPENLSGFNVENNQGNNPENNPGSNPENNPPTNAQNNSENNPGNNPESNPGPNTGQGPGNISEGPAGCVLGCYPGCNPGCDPACKPSVCNFGNASGSNPGNTSGGNSGNNPGNNPGNNSASGNQYNLPVINPIPTDAQVSQSIALQNQQNNALWALVAGHQALVAPAQQQAQASKYQTVNSQNIPAPSTDPAPADVVEKVTSHQVVVNH